MENQKQHSLYVSYMHYLRTASNVHKPQNSHPSPRRTLHKTSVLRARTHLGVLRSDAGSPLLPKVRDVWFAIIVSEKTATQLSRSSTSCPTPPFPGQTNEGQI